MAFPYHHIATEDGAETLTVFLPDGAPVVVTDDHPNYSDIREAAADELAEAQDIRELYDLAYAAGAHFEALSDRVSVADGRVFFDGDEVDNALTRQIVRALDAGLDDWSPLVRFMDNAAANPQPHSRSMLYDWLADRDFAITEDGCFIGYKGVRTADNPDNPSDALYASVNRGPITVNGDTAATTYAVGDTVTMPRSTVQHDAAVGCSTGLHVGTYAYAQGYASGALLKVKVNPRDVVSVPTDCNAEKLRTCRFDVLGTVDEEIGDVFTDADGNDYDAAPYDIPKSETAF